MKKYFLLLSLIILPIIPAYADNEILNLITIEGTIPAGQQDYTFILPESIVNLDKTVTFMSVRHIGDSNEKEIYRSWELINTTAITFYGSSDVPANNEAVSFVGYIVEFTPSSDMFTQTDSFSIAGGLSNQEFEDLFSTPVNTTSSFFQFHGQTPNHSDLTWGQEEFARMRIINATAFGYEPFDAPNSGPTVVRYGVTDLNNDEFFVQRGSLTMPEGTALSTVIPPIAVNRSHTVLFASHMINSGLDADSDESMFTARLNPSNQIEFDRDDDACGGTGLCSLSIRWELITFPDSFAEVQYVQFDDTISTSANVQQTGSITIPSVNFANSIAIGTIHTPLGLGQGRSASAPVGGFDRLAYTVELTNATNVDVVTNDGASVADIWVQVIEFQQFGGLGDINDDIQQQPSCCFFFINPIIEYIKSIWLGFILLINSLGANNDMELI